MPRVMDVGQASLLGGAPRHESVRIRVAQAPPERAALGDLYVVVESRNERLSRSFCDTVAAAYHSSDPTNVIAGLSNGMQTALQAVAVGAGPDEPAAALGATGAVVVEDEVYIAQALPSQVYILRESVLNALPEDYVSSPYDDQIAPEQEVDLFRAKMQDGDVIVLASTDLRQALTEREIRGLLLRQSAQESAHDLCALVAQRGEERCEVLVLRIASVAAPLTEITRGAGAGRMPAGAAPSTNGQSGSSNALREAPPAREPDWPAGRAPVTRAPGGTRPKGLVGRLASLPLKIIILVLIFPVLVARAVLGLVTGRSRQAALPDLPGPAPEPDLEADWSTMRNLRTGSAGQPASAGPPAYDAPPSDPSLDYLTPRHQQGNAGSLYRRRRTLPGPGTLLFAFSLVVLVTMGVVLALRNTGDNAESEPGASPQTGDATPAAGAEAPPTENTLSRALELFDLAETRFREAQDREPDENRAATLLTLRNAKDLANQALGADLDRTLAPDINRLLSQIGREEDRLNRVRKLVPSATIGEFDTAGVGSATAPLDVRVDAKYVVDAVTGRVVEFATAKQGATVLRKGDVVGAVTVGNPIAVVNRALSVLVIDDRFNVFSLQADQTPRLLRMSGTEDWRTPLAFDNFNNNLYILDPGASSIFKYQATAGGYEVAPTDYLDPRDPIDLSTAVDFAIDGDIYVLFANGEVRRFQSGREVAFEISGLDGDTVRPTKIFTETDTDSLYLVDAPNKRIVEIDKREGSEGSFVRQFKYAGSDDFFADIREIWVSEIDGKLVVLGRDSLRQFVLPRIQAEPGA